MTTVPEERINLGMSHQEAIDAAELIPDGTEAELKVLKITARSPEASEKAPPATVTFQVINNGDPKANGKFVDYPLYAKPLGKLINATSGQFGLDNEGNILDSSYDVTVQGTVKVKT